MYDLKQTNIAHQITPNVFPFTVARNPINLVISMKVCLKKYVRLIMSNFWPLLPPLSLFVFFDRKDWVLYGSFVSDRPPPTPYGWTYFLNGPYFYSNLNMIKLANAMHLCHTSKGRTHEHWLRIEIVNCWNSVSKSYPEHFWVHSWTSLHWVLSWGTRKLN